MAEVDPEQTAGLAPRVIVGFGFIVTLIAYPLLTHPVELILTVSVPVYVAGAAAPGTVSTMGVAGNAAFTTFTKPAAIAAALYVILYWSGESVVPV